MLPSAAAPAARARCCARRRTLRALAPRARVAAHAAAARAAARAAASRRLRARLGERLATNSSKTIVLPKKLSPHTAQRARVSKMAVSSPAFGVPLGPGA